MLHDRRALAGLDDLRRGSVYGRKDRRTLRGAARNRLLGVAVPAIEQKYGIGRHIAYLTSSAAYRNHDRATSGTLPLRALDVGWSLVIFGVSSVAQYIRLS